MDVRLLGAPPGMPGLVAITGGTGFIGKALVQQCLAQGWRVRVLSRRPGVWQASEALQVYEGDLTQTQDWSDFVQGVDVLIHCAAEIRSPTRMLAVNVDGAGRLLDAAIAAKVRRWVQLSSVGAYGPVQAGWVTEDTPENPVGPYEVSKTVFDRRLRKVAVASRLEVCILRPSNVYGEGMPNQSLFQMLRMIQQGWFAYMGARGASANYVHVRDVVNALMLCACHPRAVGRTYNISDWTTIENMVEAMARTMHVDPPWLRFPLSLAQGGAYAMRWWRRWPLTLSRVRALSNRSRYSTARITSELGWRVGTPIMCGMQGLVRPTVSSAGASIQEPLRGLKVLIVTYDWPPRNSIATHRPYSWAKYWSMHGCEVTVLTAVKKFYDLPLDLDLPVLPGIRVVEVDYNSLIPALNPVASQYAPFITDILKKAKGLISSVLGWHYDVRSNWAASVAHMAEELDRDFDVVVSTYGPDSAHKIASEFKRANPSVFWLADYRDLWSQNARNKSSKLMGAMVRRKELGVVRSADLFTTVSEELAATLEGLVKTKPEVVFNGFDIDLDPTNYQQQLVVTGDRLHVVYTGRIYPGKRDPSALVRAIENLIDAGRIRKDQVCVDFYGGNTQVIDAELKEIKYPEIVHHHGHVPRSEALALQKRANLLLLLESGDEDSKGFLTGKIFEYIGAGRPIISIGSAADSAIARVLMETGCGRCYENDTGALEEDLWHYLHGTPPVWFVPNLKAIARYSRRYQAERLLNNIRSRLQR